MVLNTLEITYMRQPEKSRLCGQYCLAMISGKTIDEIVDLVGTKKGTNTKNIVESLDKLGIKNSQRLISRGTKELPTAAICKVRREWNKSGGWHWVLLHNSKIYDPDPFIEKGLKEVMQLEEFEKEMLKINRKLSSYITLEL